MTAEHRLYVSPIAAAATVLVVLIAGVGGTYFVMRDASPGAGGASPPEVSAIRPPTADRQLPSASAGSPSAPVPDVAVTLTREAIDRAGITVTAVSTQTMTETLRLPGIVEPNAYRQVSITPLVAGRVVRVTAHLGERVRRGQVVAQVYSPELAEARTKYVAAKAMLEAHDRELQRTQKLVEIGAASRQELERIHAEHAAQTAEVDSARSRLQLLGTTGDDASPSSGASATMDVRAPIDGVVTERFANVGLNVDPSTKLLSIVDLSSVWIVANVYEKDLQRVHEGVSTTVTTNAYPDLALDGRIGYIDPQLNAETRTAKVRVEVPNPRGVLRLGMYTDVAIAASRTSSALSVPKGAIQTVGDRQVVYLAQANEPAKFVEREVRIGRSSGDLVEVLFGVAAGDAVVSNGSFFVRAEVERLGLRASQPQASSSRQPLGDSRPPAARAQAVRIAVTEKGYEPGKVSLRAGVPARLTFVRTTDKTCGTEVVFPSLNIKRALPLNEPVVIEFTPSKTEDIAFVCGMNMLRGIVAVE